MLVVGQEGVTSFHPFPPAPSAHCIFEHVYFARPDSYVFGQSVNEVRTELGRQLAREAAVAGRRDRPDSRLRRVRGDRLCRGVRHCRCAWGSSAITTSAERSSSRTSRFATSACA